MRVLQVIQDLAPGGAERVVLSLIAAAAVPEAGHSMGVAATPGPWSPPVGVEQYPLSRVGRQPARLVGCAIDVRRAVARFRPDIVHAHNPGMAAAVAMATLRGRRPPAIATMHGVPEEDYAAAARLLRLSGLPVVGCGPGVTAALADHGVVADTIVNGVGPAPISAERDVLLRQLGLDPARPLVVAVGRLVAQKNQAIAVEAMASVKGAALVVVGDGPLAPALRDQVRRLDLADRVVLTGARDDARSILAAADVAVLTSRWEGLPLVALEVLAAGVPLVATDVRGIRELLTDGVDSLLVPDDDVAATAAAINRLVGDAARRDRLAGGGLAMAARYTEAAMVQSYFRLYETTAA